MILQMDAEHVGAAGKTPMATKPQAAAGAIATA
jgi:hypothetical protein